MGRVYFLYLYTVYCKYGKDITCTGEESEYYLYYRYDYGEDIFCTVVKMVIIYYQVW